MRWRLIVNNLKRNKLVNLSIFTFMAVSCVLFAVTMCLTVQLIGSISNLMTVAKTPDFLQMHAGEIDEDRIKEFADAHEEVTAFQICRFLNLDSADMYLADHSLSGSSQDNGVCVQSEFFDFLVDMENEIPVLQQGEIGVPVCYMREYGLKLGDTVTIADDTFEIACFIRDSQMNSMMASSKRFLICDQDYARLVDRGEEEYLIEFLLAKDTNTAAFTTEYTEAELPVNGPCITKGLILLMNALSDGIMIMIILFVSILVLFVSLLCIRFIVMTGLERDQKEIGIMKAMGISKKDIRKLYFIKYALLSTVSAVVGVCIAMAISNPLGRQIKQLYGNCQKSALMFGMACMGTVLISGITLLSIWKMLKKTEKMSALQALFMLHNKTKKAGPKWYIPIVLLVAAGTMLMVVPANLLSTISAPEFVTYMGIGNSEIRIDIRQCDEIGAKALELGKQLTSDPRVTEFVRLDTITTKVLTQDDTEINLMVEYGDHSVFPVSYSKGTAPAEDNQIALSLLNAQELEVTVGDEIRVILDDEISTYEICGIYSDITNGGKTAKIADMNLDESTDPKRMWSIFYVSLNEENTDAWIAEYKMLGESSKGIKVADIASYVEATFGQTSTQIQLATGMAVIASSGILLIVLLLFTRLQIVNDRKEISLYKALGFRWKHVAVKYGKRYIWGIVFGIVTGEILGFVLGSELTGMVLRSLGADGFRFIVNLPNTMIVIPLMIMVICVSAVVCGVYEVKKIKPEECVAGRG